MPTQLSDSTWDSNESNPASTEASLEIPGYELGQRLVVDPMYVIYRARDTTLNFEVAVKVMNFLAPGSFGESQFLAGARIAAQMQHPGVPPIFHLGQLPDNRYYLVMKLIQGETLAEILRARQHPITDQVRFISLFEKLCQTMAYAHERKVVHRDLKPQHVMVDRFGDVQVIGWGLACDPQTNRPPEGQPLGTPAFMPPEQARLEWDRVDCRSDVFALGGILLVILTGYPTFHRDTVIDMIVQAAAGELAEAMTRLDNCGEDAELIALAKRCLNPDPALRPANAGELAALVAHYRTGLEERVRKSEAERLAVPLFDAEKLKRRKLQGAIVFVVGLFVIWTGAMIWWHNKQVETWRTIGKLREDDDKEFQKMVERDRISMDKRAREAKEKMLVIQKQKREQFERDLAARRKLEMKERQAPPPREVNRFQLDVPPREVKPSEN